MSYKLLQKCVWWGMSWCSSYGLRSSCCQWEVLLVFLFACFFLGGGCYLKKGKEKRSVCFSIQWYHKHYSCYFFFRGDRWTGSDIKIGVSANFVWSWMWIVQRQIVIITFQNSLSRLFGFLKIVLVLRLKAGKTKVCQFASHRACFVQGVTNFTAFENSWA